MTGGGPLEAVDPWLRVYPELVGDDPVASEQAMREHLATIDQVADGLRDWIRSGDGPPGHPPVITAEPAASRSVEDLPFSRFVDWITHDIVKDATATLSRSSLMDPHGPWDDQVRAMVRGDVASLYLRALLTVMARRGRDNLLVGDDPFRRYQDFERWLTSPSGAEQIDREFPDLAPRARGLARMVTDAMIGDLARTEQKWSHICEEMGLDPEGLVRDIRPAGDAHGGGRRVLILQTTQADVVVLKPRGVGLERGYGTFSSWLGGKIGVDMPVPVSVQDQEVGWSSFVGSTDGGEPNAHHDYYGMIGVHLASLYLLNGTDVHVENLLNDSLGRPVVIDAEALFAPSLATSDSSALLWGVRQTGLLSLRVGESDLDLGALEYRSGALSPLGSWHLVNAGRDDAHLVMRRDPVVHPEVVPARTQASAAAVRARFTEVVSWVLRHRAEVVERVRSEFAGGTPVRYIHRSTMLYAVVQRLGTHPRFARDRDRRRAFGRLAMLMPSSAPALLDVEVCELMRSDIPLFWVDLDGSVIRDSTGVSTGVATARSPREQVVQGIETLTEEEVAAQLADLDDGLAHWTVDPRRV